MLSTKKFGIQQLHEKTTDTLLGSQTFWHDIGGHEDLPILDVRSVGFKSFAAK